MGFTWHAVLWKSNGINTTQPERTPFATRQKHHAQNGHDRPVAVSCYHRSQCFIDRFKVFIPLMLVESEDLPTTKPSQIRSSEYRTRQMLPSARTGNRVCYYFYRESKLAISPQPSQIDLRLDRRLYLRRGVFSAAATLEFPGKLHDSQEIILCTINNRIHYG